MEGNAIYEFVAAAGDKSQELCLNRLVIIFLRRLGGKFKKRANTYYMSASRDVHGLLRTANNKKSGT